MASDKITVDKPSFLVFSDDWGVHPSSCQHIFKHIIIEYKVLWVDTIGMRNIKLTKIDLRKAFLKGRKMVGSVARRQNTEECINTDNLVVIQPIMLPFVTLSAVRKFNSLMVIHTVRKKMKELKMVDPIMVTTVPNSCDYIGSLGERRVVYYCVDNFAEWPGIEKQLVHDMDEALIAKADRFVATSGKLYDRIREKGKNVALITHGVEVDHFRYLPDEEHDLLAGIPKPRVGYFGLFDERCDQKLIFDIACGMPDISFVITGEVVTEIGSLLKIPNVYFTGAVTYKELPSIVTGWDVCMLPYKKNSLTECINPLKIKEYMITGKPICATNLPEVARIDGQIFQSSKSFDWINWLHDYFAHPHQNNVRNIELVLGESWREKSKMFLQTVLF